MNYEDLIYLDFEVLKHDWTVTFLDMKGNRVIYHNNSEGLKKFRNKYKDKIFVGYNSSSYDMTIFKAILLDMNPYEISQKLIKDGLKAFQISDKFKDVNLNIFDIMTTQDSLKKLEGYMGNDITESSISFDIDKQINKEELQELLKYNVYDVQQTIEVFKYRNEQSKDFDAQLGLIEMFNLPLHYISKTKAGLSAIILEAKRPRQERKDEFKLDLPEFPNIKKYRHIYDWYSNKYNHKYYTHVEGKKEPEKHQLITELYGVETTLGWGGIHGARPKCNYEGIIVNSDVGSMYPAIMIEYDAISRNIPDKSKYVQIRDDRLIFKKNKDPRQNALKIVLNSTYGAMKDKYSALYDPRQANRVCVIGQLLLVDLLESIERELGDKYIQIQNNTDGIIGMVDSMETYNKYLDICKDWEIRSRMLLEHEIGQKIIQKDVNNYIFVVGDKIKSKGAYAKSLSPLDNDLPIVNKALVNYFVKGTSVEETINNCNELIMFQKITKVSSKYIHGIYGNYESFIVKAEDDYNYLLKNSKHWYKKESKLKSGIKLHLFISYDAEIMKERTLRLFATTDGKGCFKVKNETRIEKVAGSPEKCIIYNQSVKNKKCSDIPTLDKNWYIELTKQRIKDFKNKD